MDDIEASVMSLAMSDNTNTTHIATTSDHGDHASIEVDEVLDLPGRKVNFDGIVHLDGGIWVTNTSISLDDDLCFQPNIDPTSD